MNQAILGGTGVYKLFDDEERVMVDTRCGPAEVDLWINYRADIWNLRDPGIEFVRAGSGPGPGSRDLPSLCTALLRGPLQAADGQDLLHRARGTAGQREAP